MSSLADKDYYKALGVGKTAKLAEIKTAYRKLARKYHPDANEGDATAEERFKEISEAYSVLSDEKRRKEYDEARALASQALVVQSGTAYFKIEIEGDLADLVRSGLDIAAEAVDAVRDWVSRMPRPWRRRR